MDGEELMEEGKLVSMLVVRSMFFFSFSIFFDFFQVRVQFIRVLQNDDDRHSLEHRTCCVLV